MCPPFRKNQTPFQTSDYRLHTTFNTSRCTHITVEYNFFDHSLKYKCDGGWRKKKESKRKKKTVSEMIMSRGALPPQQLKMGHRGD